MPLYAKNTFQMYQLQSQPIRKINIKLVNEVDMVHPPKNIFCCYRPLKF